MKQDLPLSPRGLDMARHQDLGMAACRSLSRARPRPTFRTSRPSPLGPNRTGFLVGVLALLGFLFVATVLWAHATDVAATMRAQAAAMRGM
ncbi:hypothetical protein DWF04_015675 [Cereibacter sphaeroides f. sp. denitrificans]|nr:hypothetical protein DWF04_16250 [Cereibacter sphaeroides f. sp. denitrificans]